MESAVLETRQLVESVDGNALAKAWLSAALAFSDDEKRPLLWRQVAVEVFEDGLQFVGTDGYLLLRSWVTFDGDREQILPAIDEAPLFTAVARDPHGRAAGFMKYVLKTTSGENGIPMWVDVRIGPKVDEDQPTLANMEPHRVIFQIPQRERVELDIWDGDWVEWRALGAGFTAQDTSAVALNPDALARLVKLGQLNGSSLLWRFGGEDKAAQVDLRHAIPPVTGYVMPMRLTREELELKQALQDA